MPVPASKSDLQRRKTCFRRADVTSMLVPWSNPLSFSFPLSLPLFLFPKPLSVAQAGSHKIIDCWHGVEIVPSFASSKTTATATATAGTVSFDIEAHGFGCILITANSTTGTLLGNFLSSMAAFTASGPVTPPQTHTHARARAPSNKNGSPHQ